MTEVAGLGVEYIGVYTFDNLTVVGLSRVVTADEILVLGTGSVNQDSLQAASFVFPGTTLSDSQLNVSGAVSVSFPNLSAIERSTLNVSGSVSVSFPNLSAIEEGSTLNLGEAALVSPGDLVVDGSSVLVGGSLSISGDLLLSNGSLLMHPSATPTSAPRLEVSVGPDSASL